MKRIITPSIKKAIEQERSQRGKKMVHVNSHMRCISPMSKPDLRQIIALSDVERACRNAERHGHSARSRAAARRAVRMLTEAFELED